MCTTPNFLLLLIYTSLFILDAPVNTSPAMMATVFQLPFVVTVSKIAATIQMKLNARL